MKEMFASFTTNRQPAGRISARRQPSLYGSADGDVFVLNSFAGLDVCSIAGGGFGRNIREVEVKDDFGPAGAAGDNKVRVHRGGINVDHEVGVDPVIERSISAGKWTRLQAESLAQIDLIFRIVQNAIEAFVQ